MLRMDGTRPTVMPSTTLAHVQLGEPAEPPACRLLDEKDEATVRAFATRTKRHPRPVPAITDRPSYQQMKAQTSWRRAAFWAQPNRPVVTGLMAVLTFTAFSAGALAHWVVTF